jgi:hypothetical protein
VARAVRCHAIAVAVLAAFVMPSASVSAGGHGVFFETEYSDASIEKEIPFNVGKVNRDFDGFMFGAGYLYDTNIATDNPLSYRIRLGYRIGKRNPDDKTTIRLANRLAQTDLDVGDTIAKVKSKTAQGVTLTQTIGYGFIRNETYRVWAGPTVRLNADWYGLATNIDVVDIAFGGGPEIGINYHLNDRISLTSSIAYSVLYFAEHFESKGKDPTFKGYQHHVGLTFGVLWRNIDDQFGN